MLATGHMWIDTSVVRMEMCCKCKTYAPGSKDLIFLKKEKILIIIYINYMLK